MKTFSSLGTLLASFSDGREIGEPTQTARVRADLLMDSNKINKLFLSRIGKKIVKFCQDSVRSSAKYIISDCR